MRETAQSGGILTFLTGLGRVVGGRDQLGDKGWIGPVQRRDRPNVRPGRKRHELDRSRRDIDELSIDNRFWMP